MFDDDLAAAAGDRKALADLAGAVEHDSRVAGCRKLLAAAAWADVHSTVDHPEGGPLVERLVRIGPVGIPPVAEFAAQGLAGPFDTSTGSARSWMVDALTIRHRLPRLWERVVAGEVHAWQARQIASLTGHLQVGVAGQVDEQTTPWVGQLPWRTFLRALDATTLQADEQTYRERERLAAAGREVKATETQDGLRTLIARGEAGDVAMLLALYRRVAECLAHEGDEDPLPVRMSKAIGIIANPGRLTDLLLRHAGDPDQHREPWEQVAAHQADDTDPWADDLPAAGWQTAEHGIYHQPGPDDQWWWGHYPDPPAAEAWPESVDWPADPPPDPEDLAWYHRHTHPDPQPDADPHDVGGTGDVEAADNRDHGAAQDADAADRVSAGSDDTGGDDTGGDGADRTDRDGAGSGGMGRDGAGRDTAACRSAAVGTGAGVDRPAPTPWPEAFGRPRWQPLTPAQAAACAPTVVMHVHLSDHTLRDNHGVVRTDTGPILLEQLHRYLITHDATVKVYPVLDPAATAAADSYEIPLRLRRAMQIRHPRSVFPHSPASSRLDLDHTPAYTQGGPPGQTGMHTLGPLARAEHRAKTIGRWKSRQPEPGTYLWRSPEGWIAVTTNQGTLTLGHTTWATHLWETTT